MTCPRCLQRLTLQPTRRFPRHDTPATGRKCLASDLVYDDVVH